MKKVVEILFELQRLELKSEEDSVDRQAEIDAIRRRIPTPVLVNFDRFQVRGKKGVAIVRHDVCMECHLQIPRGVVASISTTEEGQRCGNCGRYLYLPAEEPAIPALAPARASKAEKPRRKRELTHAN